MSSRGIRTRDLAIHDDRRFWPRFSGILGALVKWLSSRTYAQVPLLEEVSFFMVWFDPDLPVLHIHLNNTGPTARLSARCYRARMKKFQGDFIRQLMTKAPYNYYCYNSYLKINIMIHIG